jgi:hypothetical protein
MTNDNIPKAAIAAWYQLQAALAAHHADQKAHQQAQQAINSARERASHRHSEVQAWVRTLERKS